MLRVELRFPQEILYDGEGVIKRFIESLRSQPDAGPCEIGNSLVLGS
ncbi:hypothetical protein ACWV3O_002489 [Vibrio parahaemolyticus]